MSTDNSVFSEPFGVLWRSALVKLPRYVPSQIIHLTSPEGPHPFMLSLPSRGKALIPNYVFVPTDLTPDEASSLPVVIDFHGGGFYLGSTLEQAPFCAKMARELRAAVITVDYRLGPIEKYPAAIEDAEDVLRSVLDETFKGYHVLRDAVAAKVKENYKHTDGTVEIPMKVRLDRQRIAISGFSSGGNLALNMALSIGKTENSPAWPSAIPNDFPARVPLLLYYPSLDARQLPSERTCPVGLHMSHGFFSELSDLLAPTYLPRNKAAEPRASPGLADLEGLHAKARMLLVLSGLDSLAEQSETWVKKVQDGGRGDDLKVERYPDMKHGWTQMPESWLNEEEKRTRRQIFTKTVRFTKDIWAGKDTADAGELKLTEPPAVE
ncbi:alpha/beta-hydrolase [Rhizodiscina lignyota]|uniref:Alpha/beta-hydrolase n=1 Tax=Rhizodiscina lignyota TaxID=1504668 RepID=A0A9P4MB93_9PEZI|nr:alpha/beta-hydrolase [Rhizodiscina lignyota]